jgi:hypothetical protein
VIDKIFKQIEDLPASKVGIVRRNSICGRYGVSTDSHGTFAYSIDGWVWQNIIPTMRGHWHKCAEKLIKLRPELGTNLYLLLYGGGE